MSIEVMVLGAMLRMARRRNAADVNALAIRVGDSEGAVRSALRRLDGQGLVEWAGQRQLLDAPRLTMEGFAVAVALLPKRPARSVAVSKTRAARAA